MELEGLKLCLADLERREVEIHSITTDRHGQIRSYLAERDITHRFDAWHQIKGIGKIIRAVSPNFPIFGPLLTLFRKGKRNATLR
jgi:hypothetical protein